MPQHELRLHLPSVKIDGRDSAITIKQDGKVLGYIVFSQGGLDYYLKKRKTRCISLSWTDFDALLKSQEAD